jgi:hypothetical protein
MKGTLFSADFVKDSSGNLRLLELNTDTSIISSEVPHLEWESFIDLLDTNSITKLDVIYKPAIHQEFVTYLQYAIASSSLSLDEFNLHSENISTIYPASVTDETDRFILRIAYDESSIFDSMYCKSRLETFKLFTDSNSGSFVSPFYYSSSLYEINTLEYQINPNNIPDAAIKDIDEQQNPISFYKIGSEVDDESDTDRWNAFIQNNKYEDRLIEQYNYDTSSLVDGKVTSIAQNYMNQLNDKYGDKDIEDLAKGYNDKDRIIMSTDLCLTRQSVRVLEKLGKYDKDQVDTLYKQRQSQLFNKIKEYNETHIT